MYQGGKLHPLDLKRAVGMGVADSLRESREFFERNRENYDRLIKILGQ